MDTKYLDLESLRLLVKNCLRVGKGERIYLSGNIYGRSVLDMLLRVFRDRGAKVQTWFWTDEQLITDLLENPPSAVATRWMPQPAGKGRFEIRGKGTLRFDRLITLFSRPLEFLPSALASCLGVRSREFMTRFNAFLDAATSNRQQTHEAGVPYVLLDLPTRPFASWLGLDFQKVVQVYRDAFSTDLKEIRRLNRAVAGFFFGKKHVDVTCPRGTAFGFDLGAAPWRFEDLDDREDKLLQLPGGEAYMPPVSKSGEGLVVTGAPGFEKRFTFVNGKLSEFHQKRGQRWVKATHPLVEAKHPLAEFGVGTNPGAMPVATGPIYEKAFGTVHFGVGGNSFFGGPIKRKQHRDLIVEQPEVVADGTVFSREGRWVFPGWGKPLA